MEFWESEGCEVGLGGESGGDVHGAGRDEGGMYSERLGVGCGADGDGEDGGAEARG
jgi:hypothetical protein